MTLILGMSKGEGLYLSTDHRVTDVRSGRLIDDASVKVLKLLYPPLEDGPKALVAYTGVALLRDGTPTGTWMGRVLRRNLEVFTQSMAVLGAVMDRDIAQMRLPLVVNVLAIQGNRRYFGAFSNVKTATNKRKLVVQQSFEYTMQELNQPFVFTNGSGATRALANRELDLVHDDLRRTPWRPFDHMKLLATVNRRVAEADSSVSPFCHVAFLNSDQRSSPQSHVFLERGRSVPFDLPRLHFGLDLTEVAEQELERPRTIFGRPDPDELKRRP